MKHRNISPIITLMKYFCQDYQEIPVVVTGSMVRIKIQRENRKRGRASEEKFLFPVGKINQLTIYPLDFEEFLYNANSVLYDARKEACSKRLRSMICFMRRRSNISMTI